MSSIGGTAAVAAGDEVARLYERYSEQLQRFCLGRLRSREEAEDAVQSTFLRVYTALRKGTVPDYEAAWIYKIAHNVCLTRIESSGRRAEIETPRDLDEIEHEIEAPEQFKLELAGLADALAAMPANLRQAILLREWQGLSYAEIADAMGISQSAVETLIFRARKHLAKALEHTVLRPARAVAAVFDFGLVAAGLRALLGGAKGVVGAGGLAAKLAAGSAVVLLGGAGVGAGFALSDSTAGSDAPAPTTSGQRFGLPLPDGTEREDVSAPTGTAVGTTRAGQTTQRTETKKTTTGAGTTPGSPGPAPDDPSSQPGAPTAPGTTQASTPPVTAADTPTIRPGATSPLPTATVPTPTVTAPKVPAATTPVVTATVPGVTTVATPTVTTPTVQAPTVQVPTVTAPQLPPPPTLPSGLPEPPVVTKPDDLPGTPTVPKLP